jgi:hypothetical protein
LSMELPPFFAERPRKDNWQTVAKVQQATQTAAKSRPHVTEVLLVEEDDHIF